MVYIYIAVLYLDAEQWVCDKMFVNLQYMYFYYVHVLFIFSSYVWVVVTYRDVVVVAYQDVELIFVVLLLIVI